MPSLNPAKYIRFLNKVRKLSKVSKGKTELSFLQQAKECYNLLRLNQLEPYEYFETYELWQPHLTWEDKTRFLSRNHFYLVDKALNPRKDTGVLNKLVFKIYAEHYGLPVPKTYGLFDPAFGKDENGGKLSSVEDLKKFIDGIPAEEFMVKPIGGDQARDLMRIKKLANGRLLSIGEGEMTVEELYEKICNTCDAEFPRVKDSYMFEEVVRQHPFYDRYSETSSQGVRIMTFINAEREIEIFCVTQKISRPGRAIDNVGHLGISAQIGLESGVDENGIMGPGVQATFEGLKYFDKHPDTGAQITGEKIPLFRAGQRACDKGAVMCAADACAGMGHYNYRKGSCDSGGQRFLGLGDDPVCQRPRTCRRQFRPGGPGDCGIK